MRRKIYIWCAVVLLVTATVMRGAESLHIVPLMRDGQVLVSFELTDAYTRDVRDAISSGLRTTFTYTVELRMVVPAWVDRTVAAATISITDQYDNLTRRHSLSRAIDGRIVEDLVTEDEAVVRKWLTSLARMPLCETSKLDTNRDYYVRVSARARPHGGSLLGWATAITGQAQFTFIP